MPRYRSISPRPYHPVPQYGIKQYALHIFHPNNPVVSLPLDTHSACGLLSTLSLGDIKHLSPSQLSRLSAHLSSLPAPTDTAESTAWVLEAVDIELTPETFRRKVHPAANQWSGYTETSEVVVNTWKPAKAAGEDGVFSAVCSRRVKGGPHDTPPLLPRMPVDYAYPGKTAREEVWFVEEPPRERERRRYRRPARRNVWSGDEDLILHTDSETEREDEGKKVEEEGKEGEKGKGKEGEKEKEVIDVEEEEEEEEETMIVVD